MYKCKCCGHKFEEAKEIRQYNSGFNVPDGGYVEYEYVCPECGCDDYDEVDQCELCGEYMESEALVSGICKSCLKEIVYNNPDKIWEFMQYEDNLTYFADWVLWEKHDK